MIDPNTADYVVQIEDGEYASEAVLRAVGRAADRSPLDLPPLQESIDVDALDRLFESPQSIDELRFEYSDYEVTVDSESVQVSGRE